jgi:hypothetical protein
MSHTTFQYSTFVLPKVIILNISLELSLNHSNSSSNLTPGNEISCATIMISISVHFSGHPSFSWSEFSTFLAEVNVSRLPRYDNDCYNILKKKK